MGGRFLLLRLEAPLMAFGGPVVDAIGPTRRFPGQAQVAGLLGNALGYRHGDAALLDALQARLRLASALIRPGELLRDFQTVFLGRPHLVGTGWTTRGRVEKRGGASSRETHIRERWYMADAMALLAVTLAPEGEPGLDDLARALDHPARPLFIGRKPCLPASPINMGIVDAVDAADALRQGAARLAARKPVEVEVEIDARLADDQPTGITDTLIDGRDWRNQMHTGARAVHRRTLDLATEAGS